MKLILLKNRPIRDVQNAFNKEYPFLKLEFYKPASESQPSVKSHLSYSTLQKDAGLKRDGEVEINNEITVAELEKSFLALFGLNVQVSRKSGMLWLETTMTDKWSLEKQNTHGKEISLASSDIVPDPAGTAINL